MTILHGPVPPLSRIASASSAERSHRYRDCLVTVAFTSMEDIRCAPFDSFLCFRSRCLR